MEDASRLAVRDRRTAESLSVIPAPSMLPWDQMPREPHLLDYLIILRKHQWLILTFLLTVVTVVTIASFKMKPVYQASARVEVDKESQNILPFQGGNSYDEYQDEENYIDTQAKILQSETLAIQTIKSLDLGRYSEFGGTPSPTSLSQPGAAAMRPAILGTFLGRLSVRRIPSSELVEVTFEAEDPQLAAQVVNAHLQNYLEQNFRSKYDATTQASTWLSSELEELRIKVEKSEDERIAYERENQIWQIDEKQDINTQKLADLSKAATEAETGLAQQEALYRMATSGRRGCVAGGPGQRRGSGFDQAKIRSRLPICRSAESVRTEFSEGSASRFATEGTGRRTGRGAQDNGEQRPPGIQHRAKPPSVAGGRTR